MPTADPDIFTNVHKGIRNALFETCLALGRAGDDAERGAAARQLLRKALHFVAHHGDNEDSLLLPLLRERAPAVYGRLEDAHAKVNEELEALRDAIDLVPVDELHQRTASFVALYLVHMREEEIEIDSLIRACVPTEDLVSFGRRAVERTSPADRRLMLGWMLPAMTAADVEAFLSRIPADAREELRHLVR